MIPVPSPDPQYESDKDVSTREQLMVLGTSPDVVDANRQAWEMLASVLGRDPVGAWLLTKMSHQVQRNDDTGKLEVVWSAEFERDPEVPTKPLVYAFVDQEDEKEGDA